jgi:broad specificity phosphatase PhoE
MNGNFNNPSLSGQTIGNVQKIIQGQQGGELTELGFQQS